MELDVVTGTVLVNRGAVIELKKGLRLEFQCLLQLEALHI